ncbi:ABC transporter ATP-binding protein [Uliginosibacterium sp. TH139]|uniref:ABC transporter ATP-binding protein n=1 Tax=Uliginosibacterium sp. TH139 TaxID=2067453 RepID=UPI000C7BFD76|nr:ABC transporter ATP-binding protein [Uliginosibacterium sp. TH139]PLK48085.1 ABC transporter ATP-binding protein [Uliginosibacterium sp. TH139]
MSTPGHGFSITLDDILHQYGSSVAVDHVTLEIAAGELVSLLGPSGCGKTTLLRIIGGFIQQTSGRVIVGGRPIDDLPPNKRAVGIVFQNYALFPHMSVAENIAYGLAARGEDRAAQKKRCGEMLELVQMAHLADRLPRALSGGQQQRVALARALAVEPRILLLDEPFAALDKSLRLDMQIEIKRIQRQSGTTCIMVTHDQEEALSMSDRVAVLNRGKLEQFGTPSEIYDSPQSLFVNQFVGNANQLHGSLASVSASECEVQLANGQRLRCAAPRETLSEGSAVIACIRPESLRLGNDGIGMPATVELGMPLGPTIVHEVVTDDGLRIKTSEPRLPGLEPRAAGTRIQVSPLAATSIQVFPAHI